MERGSAPDDARTQEYAMLSSMSALRGRFLPRQAPPGPPARY